MSGDTDILDDVTLDDQAIEFFFGSQQQIERPCRMMESEWVRIRWFPEIKSKRFSQLTTKQLIRDDDFIFEYP